eukprot:9684902-Heterocapsa_arctica.AAC.1
MRHRAAARPRQSMKASQGTLEGRRFEETGSERTHGENGSRDTLPGEESTKGWPGPQFAVPLIFDHKGDPKFLTQLNQTPSDLSTPPSRNISLRAGSAGGACDAPARARRAQPQAPNRAGLQPTDNSGLHTRIQHIHMTTFVATNGRSNAQSSFK